MSPDRVIDALKPVRVAIRSGCNKGCAWSAAAASFGYGAGTFEPSRVASIGSLVRPDDCVWDIGAHHGYVSLFLSQLLGPAGRIYAVEPSEKNLWFLRQHLGWNGVENVEVVPYAISDCDTKDVFGLSIDMSLCYQLGHGSEVVDVRSIESLIEKDGLQPPSFMKVDAECTEFKILAGAGKYLDNPNNLVFLSYHFLHLYRDCSGLLKELGYEVILPNYAIGLDPAGRMDVDMLAIGRNRHVPGALIDQFKAIIPYA